MACGHSGRHAVRAIKPHRAVFIGDSVSDVEVSRAVGVPCIGYTKTPRQGDELRKAGAAAITADIALLGGPHMVAWPRVRVNRRAERRRNRGASERCGTIRV